MAPAGMTAGAAGGPAFTRSENVTSRSVTGSRAAHRPSWKLKYSPLAARPLTAPAGPSTAQRNGRSSVMRIESVRSSGKRR